VEKSVKKKPKTGTKRWGATNEKDRREKATAVTDKAKPKGKRLKD